MRALELNACSPVEPSSPTECGFLAECVLSSWTKPISLVSQRRPISHAILTNPIFQSKVPFFNPNHWDSCRFCNDLYLFLFVWCFRLNFFKFYCVSATFVRKPSSTPIWPGIRCPVKVTTLLYYIICHHIILYCATL